MEQLYSSNVRKSVLLAMTLVLFNAAFASQNVSLYVRESKTVTCPALPSGYSVYACNFASPSTAITTNSVGYHGGYIKVESYFTGNISVECIQYYYYYVGNFRYYGSRTTYYIVSCKTINITLNNSYKEMTPSSYYNLTYTENPVSSLYGPIVTWESSNLSVAQVSSTGRIHAIAPGTATITAHNSSGPDKTCTVVVQSPTPTTITVTPGSLSFPRGQSRCLSYAVTPSNASYSLIWTSSNTSVATVSNGTVYGVAPGNAIITARVSGTSISDVCYVTVQPVNPTSITISHNKTVNVGQNVTVSHSVTPSNADYTITWTSSNTSVATVSNGVVYGVDNGVARITAMIGGTNLQDTCCIVVNRPTLGLYASASSGWVTPGTTISLNASYNGASVRYTTDGSTPSQSSTLYTGPIPVTDSLTLKAIAYHANYYPSEMLVGTYKVNYFQIVEQTPVNYSTISLPTIPAVTFNKSFSEGINYSEIKLFASSSLSNFSSDSVVVPGSKVVVGNTLYFIPSVSESTTKAYQFHIPAGALQSEDQEPNWVHDVYYSYIPNGSGQPLQNVSFANSDDSLIMSVGDYHILNPSINPTSGMYDSVFWHVTNPSVVSVSPYGVVEALAVGHTIVSLTAVVDDSVYTASSHVFVNGEFEVSTSVNGETGGIVYGDGTYSYQTQVTVNAVADLCYHFVQWNDGVTTNPRVFSLTQDTIFSAIFAYNEPVISYETAFACDSFFWKGNTYSNSGTYSSNTTTTMGCDSIVTLDLTVNYSSSSNESASACDSYIWNDSSYNTSGTFVYHTINDSGCDSTVTLNLIVNISTQGCDSVSACNNYNWHGNTYTSSGSYYYSTTNAVGCDSTVILNLTINNNVVVMDTVTACDSYSWIDNTYSYSGNYILNTHTAEGCDSAVYLHLTIRHSTHSPYTTMRVCDSVSLWGHTFSEDSIISHVRPNANSNGCDSIERIILYVNHTTHTATIVETCDSYYWHYHTYTQTPDTLPIYLHTDWNGCTSTDTLYLTIHQATSSTDIIEACDSVIWHGNKYTYSATWPTYKVPEGNMYGCDSTVHLNLTIHRSVSTNIYLTEHGSSYLWNDSVYTLSGTYLWTGTTEHGCDSIVTLHLTISSVDINNAEIASIRAFPSPTSGKITVDSPDKILSIAVYNLNGQRMDCNLNNDIIDLSPLGTGLYILDISTSAGRQKIKVMKK